MAGKSLPRLSITVSEARDAADQADQAVKQSSQGLRAVRGCRPGQVAAGCQEEEARHHPCANPSRKDSTPLPPFFSKRGILISSHILFSTMAANCEITSSKATSVGHEKPSEVSGRWARLGSLARNFPVWPFVIGWSRAVKSLAWARVGLH